MRVSKLELINFRTLSHLLLEDIPQFLVIISPNGFGKSSILEAIVCAKELVVSYHRPTYPYRDQKDVAMPVWPPHLRRAVKYGRRAKLKSFWRLPRNQLETAYLTAQGVNAGEGGKLKITISGPNRVKPVVTANDAIKKLFEYRNPTQGIRATRLLFTFRF